MKNPRYIKELMAHRDWGHEDLARALGLSKNTVDRWFCVDDDQKRTPSREIEAKMLAWLHEARQEAIKREQQEAEEEAVAQQREAMKQREAMRQPA